MNKESKFCVFQHTRKDTDKVFYTGLGSKEKAYSKEYYPTYWYNVTNEVEYIVDVIAEDLSWEEACELEHNVSKRIHFRRPDKEYKPRQQRPRTAAHQQKIASSNERPIYQLDLQGNIIAEFKSTKAASSALGISRDNISNVLRGKQSTAGGYKFAKKTENLMQYVIRTQR